MYESELEITFVIDTLKGEIGYAKSCLLPHDTGHISTAIGWMESRVRELEKDLSALSSAG